MKLYVLLLVLCAFMVGTPCAQAAEDAARSAQGAWAASGGDAVTCVAQATCRDGSTVSCSSGGTCVGVDASCPSQRGYVTCGGTTTYCPPCLCSATVWCLNGAILQCNGDAPNCQAVQPSCSLGSGEPGYVQCNGQRTTCYGLASCHPDKPWMCTGYCISGPSMCNGSRCCACLPEP